jgi:hypothetical protein
MGDPQRRLPLTTKRCLGVARQPMKVSKSTNFVRIQGLPRTSGRRPSMRNLEGSRRAAPQAGAEM